MKFRGSGDITPRSCRIFAILRLKKWLKSDAKNMKNAKTNNANLYCNLSPRFLRT